MPASRRKDIDAIYVGHFGGGFVKQDFPASLVLQASPALRFKPRDARRERLRHRLRRRAQRRCNVDRGEARAAVLVVGVEKMTATPGDQIGGNLMKACYVKEED